MSDEARDDLVNAFSDVELVSAIEEMSLDDAADLLEDMPAGVVKRVLEKSSRQTRESLNKLLNYPESSAGSLMTPEYVRLRKDMTVGQAFAAIRRQGENAETVYTCYVVERNRLQGVVSARSLLLSEPHTPINEIMDDNVVTVKVTDDQEYVAREMQRYDFTAMPVLDNEGMFVGIITIDDAIDVLTDESTEDMQKMAAILPDDDATTYFGTSVWTHRTACTMPTTIPPRGTWRRSRWPVTRTRPTGRWPTRYATSCPPPMYMKPEPSPPRTSCCSRAARPTAATPTA